MDRGERRAAQARIRARLMREYQFRFQDLETLTDAERAKLQRRLFRNEGKIGDKFPLFGPCRCSWCREAKTFATRRELARCDAEYEAWRTGRLDDR